MPLSTAAKAIELQLTCCERQDYGMSSKKDSNRKLKPDFSITQITPFFNEKSLLKKITKI